MVNVQGIGMRILLPAISVTVIFSAALFFIADTMLEHFANQNLDRIVISKVADITSREKRIAENLLSQSSLFSREKNVLEAYQIAYNGNLNNADDPQMELARQHLLQYFKSVENGYLENNDVKSLQIHFHVPPSRSLLRLWDKNQHKSDDLSSFRTSVASISRDHKPIVGIEIGVDGFSLRGIAPVLAENGQYLGSVESLSSFDPIVKGSVSNDKEYIAVYMKKDFLPIATRLQNASQNPISGNFVFVTSTDKNITDSVLTPELLAAGQERLKSVRINDYFTSVFPVVDLNGRQIGVIAYAYNAVELYSALRKIIWGIEILCITLLVFIITPLFFSVRSVIKPVNRTIAMLKDIAEGEGDLTMRLDASSKDEIGQLSFWFNRFIEKLQDMIRRIAENSKLVNDSANQLSTIARQLSAGAEDTSERATRVATASEEMTANLHNVASAMEESSINTNMVASAAEEMTSTINEIAENAERARDVSKNAVDQAHSASEKMEELGNAAQKISMVTETITEISEQTNLLALNATIEAARAGEAGKGFSVVANEIKDLARQTAQATINIKNQINDVQQMTRSTVMEINQISEVIGGVNDIIGTIASAVEEQTAATKEIANNISQASQGIQEVNENVSQSSIVADDISRDISKVNLAAAGISQSSKEVQNSSGSLDSMSAELRTIVGNFKV
ncbi:MAG: methyl-accepting chemotaxis protein [Desulfocapsaceae bacterium]|nr:methyl-accepting chemotaxis protein [Desulfocapsaceae bacterium]